jgi:hypothetical protein
MGTVGGDDRLPGASAASTLPRDSSLDGLEIAWEGIADILSPSPSVGRTHHGRRSGGLMKQTPYYRSPTAIVSVLAGGIAGVAAATLFTPPPSRTPPPKIARAVRDTPAEAAPAPDRKRKE